MSSFHLDLTNFAKKVGIKADTVVRRVTFEVLRGCVMKTPVDTGLARANWQVEIGTRPAGTVTELDTNGGATLAKGAQVVATVKAGGVTYLANNVPYIMALEFGHSQQAPTGMARLTLVELEAKYLAIVRGA